MFVFEYSVIGSLLLFGVYLDPIYPKIEGEHVKGVGTMGLIELQPELRTAGGEALSIHRRGDWIGDVYLIYREQDLLVGTIHLDDDYVEKGEVDGIVGEIQDYITNLAFALHVQDQNVNVFYGEYSLLEDFTDFPDEDQDDEEVTGYERWIVGQGDEGIEYQIYDDEGDLVAEAVVDIKGTSVTGEIHFTHEPSEQEMEDVEAILLKDYDHDLIDQYQFTLFVDGAEYEQVEIENEDDLDDVEGMLDEVTLEEEVDDYESRERAEVVYDLVDTKNRPLAKATCYYSEDGVDATVQLQVKPTEDTAHHVMQTVFQEVLTEPMEWVNIRLFHKGEQVDGFHFERGMDRQYV